MERAPSVRRRVVIVGAGFGGLAVARALAGGDVEVLLVDRLNFHTFQPLLYQVATAGLDAENIAHAVRGIFHDQANFDFRQAEVSGVDWNRRVLVTDGAPIGFDVLVVAAGATTATFGVAGAVEHTLPLKSLADAVAVRSHVLRQFERAAAELALIDQGALTFVVVGGGPTGVELSGALVELFSHVLTKDFRHHQVPRARVVLIEAADHLLSPFRRPSREHALRTLRARGVDVRLDAAVDRITAGAVHLRDGTVVPAGTVVWTAGVQAAPLAAAMQLPQGRAGRITVDDTLRVAGRDDVYVIGDMAAAADRAGAPYPQLAPVAIQQGRHVARQIVSGRRRRFRYRNRGVMATIGRNAAVAEFPGGLHFTGFPAWVMWLVLHLLSLIGFRNRAEVFLNWAWNYATYDRGARLIVDDTRVVG
jgi:NADH dehydrogenase